MQILRSIRLALLMLIGSLMCSCSSLRPPEYVGALTSSLQSSVQKSLKVIDLKPGFEYLLIEIDGRKTAMVLGAREVLSQQG